MPFSALQCEEMFAERPFCLFTPGEVFKEHCKKIPKFSNFNLLIQKNGKFWSVCTVFDRKRKNTENCKSAKRNLNFVKRRNGGLKLGTFMYRISINKLPSSFNNYFMKRSDVHNTQQDTATT